MKKTTFMDTELLVSTIYDHTYMDYLDADEIEYTTRKLPIFQSLLPLDTLSYEGYEVGYTGEDGNQTYVYTFITEKREFIKCVTFFPETKLDNLFLLDLEQALRSGKLVFENTDIPSNRFEGFDFSGEIRIEDLLDKTVELEGGYSYLFTALHEFPNGITGKKILPDGDAVKVFLSKAAGEELCFVIYETNSGWNVLDKEKIASVFGRK